MEQAMIAGYHNLKSPSVPSHEPSIIYHPALMAWATKMTSWVSFVLLVYHLLETSHTAL